MSDNISNAGMAHHMDALLAEMRTTLRRLSDDVADPTAGRGIGARGLVSATVGPRGHLIDLAIDSNWMATVDSQTLVKAVKEAVGNAVDDLHQQIERLPPAAERMDEMVEALDRTLNEISNDLARAIGRSALQ